MADRCVDILVVGGGLTGAALMLALQASGFSTLLVESNAFTDDKPQSFDARSLALSPASQQIFKMLDVWSLLEKDATAIDTIHVSEQHCFGSTRLHRDTTPLGFVVEMQHISRALYQVLNLDHILAPARLIALDPIKGLATISCPSGETIVQARLIVAADGTRSSMRELCGLTATTKIYPQHALVTNIGLARPHQQVAYERFTPTGPLALLPMTGLRSSLVWALSPADAKRMLELPERDFLKQLQLAFGYRLGRFIRAGQRTIYPLQQVLMPDQVLGRVVFIGNAAHTLHPVAGQGFNLGLRDVAMLAQCIVHQGLGSDMLKRYQASRHHDQQSIAYFTDGLIELFTRKIPGLRLARLGGMLALDTIPALKSELTRYARGYAGTIPDLVCGISLNAKEL